MTERLDRVPAPLRAALAAIIRWPAAALLRRVGTKDLAQWAAYRAWQQLEARKPLVAVYFAEIAIAADGADPAGYGMLARAYDQRGDPARARAALERCPPAAREGAVFALALADLDLSERRYAEAERHYRRALAMDARPPGLPDILANLGMAVAEQGWLEEGTSLLERARALAPERTNVRMLLALYCLRQRDDARAAQLYRAVLASEPDQADAHAGLAYALSALGEKEAAARQARLAAALRPDSARFRQLIDDIARSTGHAEGSETPPPRGDDRSFQR